MRIRVEASGVNFADILGRLGLYPDLPRIPVVPGYEVAGRVDGVGGGLDPSWVGRDVFALTRFGGYADVVCVPKAQVFPRPQGMSAQGNASIPVNYLTAWLLMVVMGGLKPNETVLIHSAGGGVGIAATQIAKHIGAKVIGTASAAKHGELRAVAAHLAVQAPSIRASPPTLVWSRTSTLSTTSARPPKPTSKASPMRDGSSSANAMTTAAFRVGRWSGRRSRSCWSMSGRARST